MGFDRPTVTNGKIMQQSMSFPDLATMQPFRLPRPHVRADSPIYDISSHSDTSPNTRNRVLKPDSSPYTRSRTLPRVSLNNGPYMFPEHLRTRRPEAIPLPDMFNQQALPEYRHRQNRQVMDGTVTRADQLATDRMQPPVVPLVEDRQAYFGENPQHRQAYFVENPQQSVRQERQNLPVQKTNGILAAEDDNVSIKTRAMTGNPYLGYQRFVFTLNKYPALVMTMVALWNISGRGQEMAKTGTENGAYYTALVTAVIVFISHMLLITSSHNSYNRAKAMSYLYHIAMVLEFCAAAVCIVLASINFKNYRDSTSTSGCKYKTNAPCYSNQERVAYLGTLVGCGVMIVLFAICTFVYGGLGLNLMKQRLAEEKTRGRERAYNNQGFQY
ncbi:hypothetical protein ANCCAN_12025 [Ancylostoma caninum]|uniref:MARVEL domain-containing protein n=1 Tax=Ancylostoma caninum TaxID=29170 RepID=A0A368GCB6_ANCCA|nr:hypothetical protein ANCCAN_12025 [Ancylostoma caninum]